MSSQAKKTGKGVKYALNKGELEQIIVLWITEQRKKSFKERLKLARIILKKAK